MKKIKIALSFLLMNLLIGLPVLQAQKTAEEIKISVESQDFVFKADVANPVRGGSQQLSAGYDLTITKKNIISYLPFYGRAQTIPVGASDGGIKFTSTSFDYKVAPYKKGWQITIKPKDVSNVQQLILTIFNNGSATLDVMNINRDDISFRGYIK